MEDFEDGERLGCEEERGESLVEDSLEGVVWNQACCVEEAGAPAEEIDGIVGEEVGFC